METLLSIQNLHVQLGDFHLRNICFEVKKQESLAIVGESGSGKSLLLQSILGLQKNAIIKNGTLIFENLNMLHILKNIRGAKIGYIPQEPLSALNPLHHIKKQIIESLDIHQKITDAQKNKCYLELLDRVGLGFIKEREKIYPHELSGGERQRVLIAIALANAPLLLIADEPTTALDAAFQKHILDILKHLVAENKTALILVSHNLPLVQQYCQNILVLQQGCIMDYAPKEQIFSQTYPKSPYTLQLLQSNMPQQKTHKKTQTQLLLKAEKLFVSYATKRSFLKKVEKEALQPLDLEIFQGESLGIVGESGSGKSSLAFSLMNLIQYGGIISIKIDNTFKNIALLNKKEKKFYRSFMQILFQDPFSSLSPRMSVFDIVAEGLNIHYPHKCKEERAKIVRNTLERVHLNFDKMISSYPNELSGGERQRVALAKALVLSPKILILDEPTSALDYSLRASIVELLQEIASQTSITYVCISHDLEVVQGLCQKIIVLHKGKLVEKGSYQEIFYNPKSPYTQKLLQASYYNL